MEIHGMVYRTHFKTSLLGIIIILIMAINMIIAGNVTANSTAITNDSQAQPTTLNPTLGLENPFKNWNRDVNQNRLDDLLDEKLLTNTDELVNVYINYYSKPSDEDIKYLTELGINISYIAKFLFSTLFCNRSRTSLSRGDPLCSGSCLRSILIPFLIYPGVTRGFPTG